MNRYLIAALYVMAGSVVALPLKVQGNPEPFRGERCRLTVATTIKITSDTTEEGEQTFILFDLLSGCDYSYDLTQKEVEVVLTDQPFGIIQSYSSASNRIRAPGRV
ncbi:hypothetical protein LJB94_00645 [Odoribacter sp. OttesenSCG-928-G04]|nr:hypothetical protein [Odoribacter sp. OttesenSCG-928-G04]